MRIASIDTEIKQFSKNSLYHEFQPIYSLSQWNLYGFEALLRGCDYTPDDIIQKARQKGNLFELDTLSICQSALSFFRSHYKCLLFINAFPSTIIQPFFLGEMKQLIQMNPINPQRIIIEINESEGIENFEVFLNHISILRKMGFRFALDDVGKGIIKLTEFTELNPEIVKIDKCFSSKLSTSINKQKTIHRLIDFCNNEIQLILEGIETAEDLAVAKSLGVPYGQGYILGRPNHLDSFDY